MNREDIIRMAQEAKFATEEWGDGLHHVCVFNFQGSETEITEELQRFAALVASAEREACAKLARQFGGDWAEDAIRARGQA
jgi:hypothetical protein